MILYKSRRLSEFVPCKLECRAIETHKGNMEKIYVWKHDLYQAFDEHTVYSNKYDRPR